MPRNPQDYHGKSYRREIGRELFDKLIAPVIDRTLGPCRDCIQDAGVTVAQIDEVVMVGGSTRIPLVRSAVEALFRSKPHIELNPDEVVALGAAVQAGILRGRWKTSCFWTSRRFRWGSRAWAASSPS